MDHVKLLAIGVLKHSVELWTPLTALRPADSVIADAGGQYGSKRETDLDETFANLLMFLFRFDQAGVRAKGEAHTSSR